MKIGKIFLMLSYPLLLCGSDLKLLSPSMDEECMLLESDWKQNVARRKILAADKGEMTQNLHHAKLLKFVWTGGVAPYKLKVCHGNSCNEIINIKECNFAMPNLLVGTQYTWTVTDKTNKSVSGKFITAATPRVITLPSPKGGPLNFRDIGGRKSRYGGRVRQNMVFRGTQTDWNGFDEKNRLFMVNELKIRTDLDLRYESQVKKEKANGNKSSLGDTVKWIHIPVNAYNSFTPEQNKLFAETIRVFANKNSYPVYLHCHGGVDRTGEITFLLNALAGVADEELLSDYEFSSLCLFPRPRTIAYFQKWLKGIAAFSSAELPYALQVEKYLLAIGITAAEIENIRKNLLEQNNF